MGIRQFIALMSVVALALAAVWPHNEGGPVCGDANGDRRVDVLDIQAVFDAAVTERAANALTDVNGDGQTDVLDFQLTQTRAMEPAEEHRAPVDHAPLKACHLANPPCPWAGVDRIVALVLPEPSTGFRCSSRDAYVRAADSRTERYLYRLTPNAPPSCA